MSKTIIIVGFGPGASSAVAEKFGAEGFSVALIARRPERLTVGVDALQAKGITAAAFQADAGDPAAIRRAIVKARVELGQISVLHWNASGGHGLGDLLATNPARVEDVFDVALIGLLSAVQEALPDLKKARDGALLVTNGAFADLDPAVDAFAVAHQAAGVALGNAAKAKLAGLLAARLKEESIFVGEVTVAGVIKGTGSESPGVPVVEGKAIADAFWELYQARGPLRRRVG